MGGLGGFVIGGRGGGGAEVAGEAVASKTDRTKVVAINGAETTDSGKSLSEIYREPNQSLRIELLLDYYASLSPEEYELEAAKLDELPMSERILASYLLFSKWGEVDPTGALAYSNQMGRMGFFSRPTILKSWASNDPALAAEYLAENASEFSTPTILGRRGTGGNAAGTIATEWARQDPVAALAWAKDLSGSGQTAAVANVLREVANEDPLAAIAMANTLGGEEQSSAYGAIASEWAKTDWEAMESWANGLSTAKRDAALEQAIQGLAASDPQAAGEQALLFDEGDARDNAIEVSVRSWSREEPLAAMSFLLENGSSKAQEEAIANAMSTLSRVDSTAGLEVIEYLEDGAVRDEAVRAYVYNSTAGEPEETINLAATIGDDSDRERAVRSATGQWLRSDPENANVFLENTDLMDQETIDRIRERSARENVGGRRRGRR